MSAADTIDLPVDELAMHVLNDYAQPGEWNTHSWMIKARSDYGLAGASLRAAAEAMQWLYAHGLIAHTPDQTSSDAAFVTRRGIAALEDGLSSLRAADRLQVDLHPHIERKVRRQFLMGEYDLAVFAAMKEVEVRVRLLAQAADSVIGVKLMRMAFGDGGPLADPGLDPGERVARMELFAGAIGLFKNPSSHREVKFDDPTEASETILLADLLLRILDRVEAVAPKPRG